MVPHHSTDYAINCLTAQIGRDAVGLVVYGRSLHVQCYRHLLNHTPGRNPSSPRWQPVAASDAIFDSRHRYQKKKSTKKKKKKTKKKNMEHTRKKKKEMDASLTTLPTAFLFHFSSLFRFPSSNLLVTCRLLSLKGP